MRKKTNPTLKKSFKYVYGKIKSLPNTQTPELKTTGTGTKQVPFIAEAKVTKDGRKYISLPHNNRIYEDDWGYLTNSMGKDSDGQRIGQYAVPLDEWA